MGRPLCPVLLDEDRVTVGFSNAIRGRLLCESSTQHIVGAYKKVGGLEMIMFCPV